MRHLIIGLLLIPDVSRANETIGYNLGSKFDPVKVVDTRKTSSRFSLRPPIFPGTKSLSEMRSFQDNYQDSFLRNRKTTVRSAKLQFAEFPVFGRLLNPRVEFARRTLSLPLATVKPELDFYDRILNTSIEGD